MVLTKGDFSNDHIANVDVILLVFLGASSFALFSVLSKKVLLEPIGVTTIYFLVATIASFLSMLYFSSFELPTMKEVFPVLLNGFSYLFWLNALKATEASYLVVLFDEPIVFAYEIGLVCVIISGLVNSLSYKRKIRA